MTDKEDKPGATPAEKGVAANTKVEGGSTSLPLQTGAPLPGESSDPEVHKLLAEREAHRLNREALDPPVDKEALKEVDKALKDVDKRLHELGFATE